MGTPAEPSEPTPGAGGGICGRGQEGGEIAGRYRLESRLEFGGMSTVHLARDLRLERPVAVKLLTVHHSAVDSASPRPPSSPRRSPARTALDPRDRYKTRPGAATPLSDGAKNIAPDATAAVRLAAVH